MADVFTWRITDTTSQVSDGTVLLVEWKLLLTRFDADGNLINELTHTGKTGLQIGSYSDGEFIPYEQLNEEKVIAWVQQELSNKNKDEVKNIKEQLTRKLDLVINPETKKGLPWAPVEIIPPQPTDGFAYTWSSELKQWVLDDPQPEPDIFPGK